jgi:dipeptidyl aminopeptidase/acylaminoacyl peptidase
MIAPDLLDKIAFIGTDFAKPPITGIVLRFVGLGTTGMKTGCDTMELEWGHAGALVVVPYYDPWGWMNPRVVQFVDDLVEGLRLTRKLGPEVPLIVTGGSMGGHGALTYAFKSRHAIAACMALWPACDLPFHYTERPDLPRTMRHAFGYDEIGARLIESSPLHQVKSLPRIPYLIVHGGRDLAVKQAAHSDRMVEAMRGEKLDVRYLSLSNLGHGDPLDYATSRAITDFVLQQLKKN